MTGNEQGPEPHGGDDDVANLTPPTERPADPTQPSPREEKPRDELPPTIKGASPASPLPRQTSRLKRPRFHRTGGTFQSPVPLCDLTSERLLRDAPRVQWENGTHPALGGIPLLGKLGQGGMGCVYFGVHPRLNSGVAVKVLPFHLAEQDPTLVDRFIREAQMAAEIRSPHLVQVLDVNEDAGLYFIVMEYVRGTTAGKILTALRQKQAGLTMNDAIEITIAATTGLDAAHCMGIIHRDIKPDNIIVPYRSREGALEVGAAKLMDLGLARAQSSDGRTGLTATQSAMGTPGYMAPEQAMEARSADKRSDIFSMGATLFALLYGKSPFHRDSPMKTIFATMHDPTPDVAALRKDVAPEVVRMIERCLSKKPDDRFNDAEEMLQELYRCREFARGTSAPPRPLAVEPSVPRETRVPPSSAIPLPPVTQHEAPPRPPQAPAPPTLVELPPAPEPAPAAVSEVRPTTPVPLPPPASEPVAAPSPPDLPAEPAAPPTPAPLIEENETGQTESEAGQQPREYPTLPVIQAVRLEEGSSITQWVTQTWKERRWIPISAGAAALVALALLAFWGGGEDTPQPAKVAQPEPSKPKQPTPAPIASTAPDKDKEKEPEIARKPPVEDPQQAALRAEQLRAKQAEAKRASDFASHMATADSYLAKDKLLDAERELDAADKLFANDDRIAQRRKKVAERGEELQRVAAEQRRRTQFTDALAAHDAAIKSGKLDDAETKLTEASGLYRDDPLLKPRREKLSALKAEQEKQAKLGRELDAFDAALKDGGDLSAAEKNLENARALAATDPRVTQRTQALKARREELDKRALFDRLVAGAEDGIRLEGDLEPARSKLEAAQGLYPDDPTLKPLAEKLAAAKQRIEERAREQRRRADFEQELRRIDAAITAGTLPGLDAQLEQAARQYPQDAGLAPLRKKLAAAQAEIQRRQALAAEQARRRTEFESLKSQAESNITAGTLSVARERIIAAERLFPQDPGVAELKAKFNTAADAAEAAERRTRHRDLLSSAEQLLREGGLSAAERRLDEAEKLIPGEQTVTALRQRIAAAREQQRASAPASYTRPEPSPQPRRSESSSPNRGSIGEMLIE